MWQLQNSLMEWSRWENGDAGLPFRLREELSTSIFNFIFLVDNYGLNFFKTALSLIIISGVENLYNFSPFRLELYIINVDVCIINTLLTYKVLIIN